MAWRKEKVFCLWKWTRVMAFIALSLHLCENRVQKILPIDVNVTQKLYQAEKNQNITLDFTFTTKPECLQNLRLVACNRIEDHKVLYHYVEVDGKKDSETQDEQFSGRVQSDKDVLREGRIRLHMSRLKMEDSGFYICQLEIGLCLGFDTFNLNVTEPHPSELPPTISPPPESRGKTGLYFVAAAVIVVAILITVCCTRRTDNSESQPLQSRRQTAS